LQVEGSDCRWRGAIASGGKQLKVEGSDRRRSDRRWREAIAGGGKRSLKVGSDQGVIAGGWKQSHSFFNAKFIYEVANVSGIFA
jgi:hypothetical protein